MTFKERIVRKLWIILGLVFFFGMLFGAGLKKPTIKEVKLERKVEVVKEVCLREEIWRDLKKIDDVSLQIASDGFLVMSEIFNAIGENDDTTMIKKIYEFEELTLDMEVAAQTRENILDKLGY